MLDEWIDAAVLIASYIIISTHHHHHHHHLFMAVGYYLHCRSPHQYADGTMTELVEARYRRTDAHFLRHL